jgi:hypothetical protein
VFYRTYRGGALVELLERASISVALWGAQIDVRLNKNTLVSIAFQGAGRKRRGGTRNGTQRASLRLRK